MPYFNDTLNVYERLSKFCKTDHIEVGHLISTLIEDFLIKQGVVKRE